MLTTILKLQEKEMYHCNAKCSGKNEDTIPLNFITTKNQTHCKCSAVKLTFQHGVYKKEDSSDNQRKISCPSRFGKSYNLEECRRKVQSSSKHFNLLDQAQGRHIQEVRV